MTTRYWKVTDAQGRSCHGGNYQWSLPTWNGKKWAPGAWTHRIDSVLPCSSGWHICEDSHLRKWLHERIWEVQIHPTALTTVLGDKVVTSGPVRLVAGTPWDEVAARLFAVECAARVLDAANDEQCDVACEVSFRYALGDATVLELYAAWSAAEFAVWRADGRVPWRAAWSTAEWAAWSAAESAAWSAAESAAESAVRAAESAAESAAWSAAESVADSAAESTAKRAAVSAAECTAWRAAQGTEWSEQTLGLLRWLEVEP